MGTLYTITFTGEILEGFEKESVMQNLVKLFGLTELQAEKVLSVPGTTLKKQVDEATRQKYEALLAEAGIKTESIAISEKQQAAKGVKLKTAPALKSKDAKAFATRALSFTFTGNGREYFSIWIVNVALTLVTFGLYSAWAKVRRMRYFYQNIRLDDNAFTYQGNPLKILKGRLIIAAFLALYVVSSQLFKSIALLPVILLIAVIPWLLIRSSVFKTQNSSFRNVTFSFHATYLEAAKVFVLWPLLGALTLGVLVPFAYCKQVDYLINHSRYGTTRFRFDANTSDYYWLILKSLLILLAGFAVTMIVSIVVGQPVLQSGVLYSLIYIIRMIPFLISCLFVMFYFSMNHLQLLLRSTTIAAHGFRVNFEIKEYIKILIVNSAATILTAGLYFPWAVARITHYRLNHITLIFTGDLDEFIKSANQPNSLQEPEISSFLEYDLGL